jgi:hypothetical protein
VVLDKCFINYFLLICRIFCKKYKMMVGELFIHIPSLCNVNWEKQHLGVFIFINEAVVPTRMLLILPLDIHYSLVTVCSTLQNYSHVDCQFVVLAATIANKLASKSRRSWRFRYASSNTIARHHWVGSTPHTGDLHASLSSSVSIALEHTLNHRMFIGFSTV